MVCKEDVVSWFKELESYKRIDTMCTLLNMCLPFELRFIGTYLEELGKRDFQELRGAELRANNPIDLAADIGGASIDARIRRKMALYVSLLRSCNFACASTLYNVMVSLEQSGVLKGLVGDVLEEILLLYTMALHHPAFTFDQKHHFGDILEKLKMEEQRIYFTESELISISHSSLQPNLSVPPPSLPSIGPPPGLVFHKSSIQGLPSSSSDHELTSPVPVSTPVTSGTNIHPVSDIHHGPPPGIPIPQYSITDFVVGQPPWPQIIMAPINPNIEPLNYPRTSSPGTSSQSESRASSPRKRRLSRSPPQQTAPQQPASLPPTSTAPPEPLPARTPPVPLPPERFIPHNLASAFESLSVMDMQRAAEKLNGVRRRRTRSSSSSPSPPPPGQAVPAQIPPGSHYIYPRTFYAAPPGFAPPPPPPPFANGEPPPPMPYAGFVPVLFAPPKLSCWNCGGVGHAGHDCKEPSMEEITRAGGYQLDFAPPDK